MKSLFIKLTIAGIVSGVLVKVYAHKDDLQLFDSSAPVVPVIAKSIEDAQRHIWEAEAAAEAAQRPLKNMFCLSDDEESEPISIELPAEQYLEKDKDSLEHAKHLLNWAFKKTQKCKTALKTQAAQKAVDAILAAASIDLTDIENALKRWKKKLPKKYPKYAVESAIHERFQTSHSNASKVLFAYITPSILAGSKDEQADMQLLCEHFYKITYPLIQGIVERSMFYDGLRGHAAECHDIIPRSDFVARAVILQAVNFFGDLAMKNADDEDSCVTSVSAFAAVQQFAKGLKLSFIDKLKKAPSQFIFADQNAFQRFENFCAKAPILFNFCTANTQSTIESKLWKSGWSYWEQKNYQTIWVDPNGCISMRIKDDGEFIVAFLSESPYCADGSLDRTYLGDRSAELIKYAPVRGVSFFVPASLNDAITGFWTEYTKSQIVHGGKKIMDFAHGKVK